MRMSLSTIVTAAFLALGASTALSQNADADVTGSLVTGSLAQDQSTAAASERVLSLSADQKHTIRAKVFTPRAPRVAKPNFSLEIGTAVPAKVQSRTVPQALVDVHPALRGYHYFVVGREIVIIEPGTSIIVALIEV